MMQNINIDLGVIFNQMSIIRNEYNTLSEVTLDENFEAGWSSSNASLIQEKIAEIKLSLGNINESINNIAQRLSDLSIHVSQVDSSQHVSQAGSSHTFSNSNSSFHTNYVK